VYDGVFMTRVLAANDNDGSRHHNHWRHEVVDGVDGWIDG